ncbi:MAG TPA: tyrosine-type recombinase/integrase [Syntrophobacteraceae bacterium]|nr:tyrosine-type recombinase/integrase [Syntrophobacteraceae bacterium]
MTRRIISDGTAGGKDNRKNHNTKIWFTIRDYGECAGLALPGYRRHRVRHAYGFPLAHQGADTRLMEDSPGYRDIQHTVSYAATSPARFQSNLIPCYSPVSRRVILYGFL